MRSNAVCRCSGAAIRTSRCDMPVYMFNKPRGYITACRDSQRATIMDCLPESLRDLHPVGRLDIDTEGLLILTDDGRLDNLLMQPGRKVEKCYFFYAMGRLDDEGISALEAGIELYHTGNTACQAKVELVGYSRVRDHIAYYPQSKLSKWMKNPDGCVSAGYLTITEGKKHQVKLMIKSTGCHVFYLKRVRIGGLKLDPELPLGGVRELTDSELEALCADYTRIIAPHTPDQANY